jgi:sterol desaturase/sphingolipid hydroxylase (fatty acid hydroxylase superfamily)
MTTLSLWLQGLSSIGFIVIAIALVALVELAIPHRARSAAHRAHLVPNLALTGITFATNLVLNVALVSALFWAEARGVGLLHVAGLPPAVAGLAAVLVLDLSFYVAHVGMHEVPFLWRFHRIHHSDLALDVTSTIRQHPGEGLYRYAALAATALVFGASPAGFAVYRVASALNGLLEHANIRVPRRVDALLSLVTTWPGVHRVHHSRIAEETDSNYGNLFSWWDRMFGTFVPADRGDGVVYGLDGFDGAHPRSTASLLAMPFVTRPSTPARPGDDAQQAQQSGDLGVRDGHEPAVEAGLHLACHEISPPGSDTRRPAPSR